MQKQIFISAVSIFILVQVCLAESSAPTAEQAESNAGTITGKVFDAEDQHIAGAVVVLCNQSSGVPVCKETFRPFTEAVLAQKGDSLKDVVYAVTNDQGCFSFEKLPAGEYRLVAQSWKDTEKLKGILEVNGKEIELHGIAEHIKVSSEILPDIALRPLGTGILQIDENMPNDETLLVISTSPTRADPILGFAGWGGPFIQNMIGGNRMPEGKTTVYGLPQGRVYLAIFAADSIPGWTEGHADIKSGATTILDYIQFVNSWSNSRHEPPEKLRPLVEELKSIMKSGLPLDENHPLVQFYELLPKEEPEGIWVWQQLISRHLDREFELPSGRKATFGDIAAAQGYIQLQQFVKKREEKRKKHAELIEKFEEKRLARKTTDKEKQQEIQRLTDDSSPPYFFPDDAEAGKELDELWPIKIHAFKKMSKEEIFEVIRKGLRRTSMNKNDIIGFIGSKYVWTRDLSDQTAVDIMYYASFDAALKQKAFYYGLTVANPKSPKVLNRLVNLAMEGYGIGRIAWGLQDQREEFLSLLKPHLNSSDPKESQQAQNVARVIEGKKSGVYSIRKGETKPEDFEKLKKDFGDKLGQIRQALLTGKSSLRLAELERICSFRIYLLFDDTFISAIQACAKDENAGVRAKTAEIAGYYWIWGNTVKNSEITQLLIQLSEDKVEEVRFVAVEKGLFNIPNKTEDVIRRIIDITLADKEKLPERLYDRISYVLRRNRRKTRKILQEYLDGDEHDYELVATLYRDALRADPSVIGEKTKASIDVLQRQK